MIRRKNGTEDRVGIQALTVGDCIGWDQERQTFRAWSREHSDLELINWDNGDDQNLQDLTLKQAEDILWRLIPAVLGLHCQNITKQYPAFNAVVLLVKRPPQSPKA
jgi:hypothetical protein